MSWITDLIGAGAKLIGRAVGLKPGPDVAPLPKAHWIPPHNSVQAWDAGPARCYYCLAHELAPQFQKPCPRKRPGGVELA